MEARVEHTDKLVGIHVKRVAMVEGNDVAMTTLCLLLVVRVNGNKYKIQGKGEI